MTIERDFKALMGSSVVVYQLSGLDKYGKRGHEITGAVYSARVQPTSRMTRDDQGREVAVVGDVYIYGAPAITTDHKISLPDGSTPVILGVRLVNDEKGPHHTVVMVGRA